MADEYAAVRSSGLKLKGEKKKKKKKSKEKKRKAEEEEAALNRRHDDIFWQVTGLDDMTGGMAVVEAEEGGYIRACDNGSLELGPPRAPEHRAKMAAAGVQLPDDKPEAEEILTVLRVNNTRVAFKTAFGRYVSVDEASGEVSALTEAMGMRELWEPIFDAEGHVYFRGNNKKFLSIERGEPIKATSDAPGPGTHFVIFSGAEREVKKKRRAVGEDAERDEKADETSLEEDYSKRFQSFMDGRRRLANTDLRTIKSAKKQGNLHEVLLEQRSKQKSDRYCK